MENEMKVIVLHGYENTGKTTVLNSLVYPHLLNKLNYSIIKDTLKILGRGHYGQKGFNEDEAKKTLTYVNDKGEIVCLDFRVILKSPLGVKIGFVTQGDHVICGKNAADIEISVKKHLQYFKDKGCSLVVCAVQKRDNQKIFKQVKEFDPDPIEISMEEYIQGIYGDVAEKVIRTFDSKMKELESKK